MRGGDAYAAVLGRWRWVSSSRFGDGGDSSLCDVPSPLPLILKEAAN
jgi:hypothetical protein